MPAHARTRDRRTRTPLQVLAAALLVLLAAVPAFSMTPGTGTALGIPGGGGGQNYTPPLGGYYYLYSSVAMPGDVWQVTSAAPPTAADPITGTAALVQLNANYAKVIGQTMGWIKVDVLRTGAVIDTAYYRLYNIVTLEDDQGGQIGYDPRYGQSSGTFPEEGGLYHSQGTAEVASKEMQGWNDLLAGQSTEWTGSALGQARTAIRMPEAQLLGAASGQGNSIVACSRDNQYVRLWLNGPRENIPIPIYLHCTDLAGGSVHPGVGSYQIKVHYFTPPAPNQANGNWTYPMNVPQIGPVLLHVKRLMFADSTNPSMQRNWILRIPWKGLSTSTQYADIEVEAQIPNPNQVAKQYGHDPTGLEEGSMMLRFGTVVDLERIDVRAREPDDLGKLRTHWFRRTKYRIANQDNVCEPHKVSLGLGAKVLEGARASDPAVIAVVDSPDAQSADPIRDAPLFAELMANLIDEVMFVSEGEPEDPFTHSVWSRADIPQDVAEPWTNTPASLRVGVKGYVGIIADTPAPDDYDTEAAEAASAATREIDVHFINVLADVNQDGLVDASDDDNELEEGAGDGPGLIVNYDPNGGTGPLQAADKNLQKVVVRFSGSTHYSGYEVQVDAHDSLVVWKDNSRQNRCEFDQENQVWKISIPTGGADAVVWLGTTSGVVSWDLDFSIVELGSASDPLFDRPQRMHMDRLHVTCTGAGLDVDSNNDGTVNDTDDAIEESLPGLWVLASATDTPNEYSLVIRKHRKWTDLLQSAAKLYRDGAGSFVVADAGGQTVMSESATSATLASSDLSGTGSVTYKIKAPKDTTVPGTAKLRLEIETSGRVVAYDWVQISVLGLELESVEFASDYQSGGAARLKKSPDDNFRGVGSAYEKPEWLNDETERNNPVAHRKNTSVQLKVRVKVEPSGQQYVLIGDSANAYLDFDSGTRTATGSTETVTVTAASTLPDRCQRLSESIQWKIRVLGDTPKEIELKSSGAHEILVTVDAPNEENSWNETNSFAYKRVREVVEKAGSSSSVGNIAAAIQQWRDTYGIDTSDMTVTNGTNGDELWALLDKTEKGQCAEGSLLMEQAMRLLGISALYQHVLPTNALPVPVHSGESQAASPERSHHDGDEKLWMHFTNAGNFSGWNEGEGCCLVDGKLYTAWAGLFIGVSGTVIDGTTAASAAHHVLLRLELDHDRLQRWLLEPTENEVECEDQAEVPVPRNN